MAAMWNGSRVREVRRELRALKRAGDLPRDWVFKAHHRDGMIRVLAWSPRPVIDTWTEHPEKTGETFDVSARLRAMKSLDGERVAVEVMHF